MSVKEFEERTLKAKEMLERICKQIGETDLKEGTKAVVVVRHKGIADILEKFSRKVERDVLKRCSKRISGGEKVIAVDTSVFLDEFDRVKEKIGRS
jgi:predicted DNA-binding antitoxin AbrB/MazE fold protein